MSIFKVKPEYNPGMLKMEINPNAPFENVVENRITKIREVLASKAKEYSSKTDRLYNFKQGAVYSNQTPKAYLWSLATKHLTNVIDLAHDKLPNDEALVEEKVGDLINYLILLEALLKEERCENN